MLPAFRFPIQCFQFAAKRFPHVDDSPAHGEEILFPFFEELCVVEDRACDAGAVGRGVADFTSLEDGELRRYSTDGVLSVRAGTGDEMECARSFTVEAEVLGEGLSDAEFESLFDEVADGPGIVFEIPGCETLVCAVEEWEVVSGSDDLCKVGPLGAGGVDAGGVVGAGV